MREARSGNAEAGFVYRSDALTSRKARIAFAVAPGSYSRIEYPAGILKATKHPEAAEDFYRYLQSKEAMDIFITYGFMVPK